MKTNDYKKRFIDLFKEMEQELGDCVGVEIDRDDEVAYGGEIVKKNYKCRIRF